MSEGNGKYAPLPGKILGRPVNMGGHWLTFAPLTLDQVQEFEGKIKELEGGAGMTGAQTMEAGLPVLLASLNRNYPDLTLAELRALVDIATFREATAAVVDVSGYKRSLPGEIPPASP